MLLHLLRRMLRQTRWRRYRLRRTGGLSRLIAWVLVIIAIHTTAMVVLEGMSIVDALWLTCTTIVTVGYGDLVPRTAEGRLATILLLYVGAIFVVAKAASDWFDARAEMLERKFNGTWEWKMQDHLLVIGNPCQGLPDSAADFFARLVRQMHTAEGWEEVPVQLLTVVFESSGLPAALRDTGTVWYAGRPANHRALSACSPHLARAVIVLADTETDPTSDAFTFDTIDRIRQAGFTKQLVAECVDDRNRIRLRSIGASTLVRPMRGYPEMLARSLIAPGSEEIIIDLFTNEGDECCRIDLPAPWTGDWTDLCLVIMRERIGTPIGYADDHDQVITNPLDRDTVTAKALFIIVHDREQPGLTERVRRLVAKHGPKRAG